MFTGIIEAKGRVKSVEKRGASGRITIETALQLNEINPGDSIAVDGVCLTVTYAGGGAFSADLSLETLKTTTLGGQVTKGSSVNLERAMTLAKPVGGHLVTGHIDGLGKIKSRAAKGDFLDIEVTLPDGLDGQVARKGSVAIDGISLTVREIKGALLGISIIPQTLKVTTLADKPAGSMVNIETDILAKYVETFLKKRGNTGVTEGFLAEHGFLDK